MRIISGRHARRVSTRQPKRSYCKKCTHSNPQEVINQIAEKIKRPMICPCCKGRGSIPSDYERMNPYTGYIQKDPDRPCLYCMGKGVA